MSIGLLFWIVYVISFFFGGFTVYTPGNWKPFGSFGVVMLLIFLLGWKVFGFVIQN